MNALQRRIKRIVTRLGESFTCGATAGTGIFAVLTSGQASTYIASSDLSALPRPIRVAYVPYDDATAENATVIWAGKTLTVRRAVDVRFHGSTIARVLVLA